MQDQVLFGSVGPLLWAGHVTKTNLEASLFHHRLPSSSSHLAISLYLPLQLAGSLSTAGALRPWLAYDCLVARVDGTASARHRIGYLDSRCFDSWPAAGMFFGNTTTPPMDAWTEALFCNHLLICMPLLKTRIINWLKIGSNSHEESSVPFFFISDFVLSLSKEFYDTYVKFTRFINSHVLPIDTRHEQPFSPLPRSADLSDHGAHGRGINGWVLRKRIGEGRGGLMSRASQTCRAYVGT